jgi:hypothetical protein
VKWKVVTFVLGVCLFCFAGYTSLRDLAFHQRKFDSIFWKQGSPRIRGEMVESLHRGSFLHGKNREETLALLGKPDEDHTGVFVYRIDLGRRLGWHPLVESLWVEFDDGLIVSRLEQTD